MQNIVSNVDNGLDMVSKGYVPAERGGIDSFSSFLTKGVEDQFNGAMTISDITTVFPKVALYNVLRQYCLSVSTDSSYIEVPSTGDVVLSTNSSVHNSSYSGPVRIYLSEEYAKWLIPRSLFQKIHGYHEYLKSIFANEIAAIEKSIFVSGKTGSEILGIIRSIEVDQNLANISIDIENLLKIKFSLQERYRRDAIFMMSSHVLSSISSLKDTTGRLIFDGFDRLLGHKVEVIDELGNNIIFSDFKQSTVLAERLNSKIEMHSNFDNPSLIGLSMPIAVGVGIINKDAIVLATVESLSITTESGGVTSDKG